jgi:hypothetical protein
MMVVVLGDFCVCCVLGAIGGTDGWGTRRGGVY